MKARLRLNSYLTGGHVIHELPSQVVVTRFVRHQAVNDLIRRFTLRPSKVDTGQQLRVVSQEGANEPMEGRLFQ